MERKYKKLYITCGIFLVIAIALLLIGGNLAGWDIAGWFNISTSKYFQWTLIAVVSLLMISLSFATMNYFKKHSR